MSSFYANDTPGFIARTPGLKCQRCGKDISGRAASTKHCFACSNELDKQRQRERKQKIKNLIARDTVKEVAYIVHTTDNCEVYYAICPTCNMILESSVITRTPSVTGSFCKYCGQRLQEG